MGIKRLWQHYSKTYFEQSVLIYPLITFRVIFGVLMMYSTAQFMAMGWVDNHYVDPVFHFSYYGFEWVKPLGRVGMYMVHLLLVFSALMVTLGYYYRIATVILFLTFTYTELIDLTYYLNHYYFVSLVSFLLIFLPANRCLSLDVRFHRITYANHIPRWTTDGLKLMLAIVYCYAGLAKINADWLLDAMPLKLWLPVHDKMPLLGLFFKWDWTPYLFSWAGMLFDCTVIFFLAYQPSRKLAYVAILAFHALTGLLFNIGVFPIVMISLVTIYFSDQWHQSVLQTMASLFDRQHLKLLAQTELIPYQYPKRLRPILRSSLVLFFVVQLLFPWRYLLYPGNVFWTEQGYRFSWRVMLMEKSGSATFFVKDGVTGREGEVINSRFLNPQQIKHMSMQPDMILQYAHFLGAYYEKENVQQPEV
ncbi:MAG: HTTM domain-containing protein, partial [Bacteroidota bacterium]